jgi:uncharacterized protein YjbI with pentapeptide repeats
MPVCVTGMLHRKMQTYEGFEISRGQEAKVMANQHHLDLLKQGVNVWNRWRTEFPGTRPDLSGDNEFKRAIDDFVGSMLVFEVSPGFPNTPSAPRKSTSHKVISRDVVPSGNFSGVDLSKVDLHEANLSYANFERANLWCADLNGANLNGANLRFANLSEAKLKKASLDFADLTGAILVGTDLTEAILTRCEIYGISVWDVQLLIT